MGFTLLSESEPSAAKDHRCLWCGESIPKGETHFHYTGKMDGEFQSSRVHLECRDAMHELHRIDRYAVEDGFDAYCFKRGSTDPR